MDTTYVLFIVLLFVAVVLALEGGYQIWASKSSAEAKRLAGRLRRMEGNSEFVELSIERRTLRRRWNWIDDAAVAGLPKGQTLLNYLETSGTGRGAAEMFLYSALLGGAGALLPFLFGKPWTFSLLLGGVLASLPWFWLGRQRSKRIELFERQIPEA
ncbi:MAG: hypothetical protein OEY03_04190, partial [Rhizobacter sp.]|nr:hypothetical protein [Rhizobacter sp.]